MLRLFKPFSGPTLPLNKVHISGGLVHGTRAVYMGGVAMGAVKLFTFQRLRTTRCCLMYRRKKEQAFILKQSCSKIPVTT